MFDFISNNLLFLVFEVVQPLFKGGTVSRLFSVLTLLVNLSNVLLALHRFVELIFRD